jgi:hypothetical protein
LQRVVHKTTVAFTPHETGCSSALPRSTLA